MKSGWMRAVLASFTTALVGCSAGSSPAGVEAPASAGGGGGPVATPQPQETPPPAPPTPLPSIEPSPVPTPTDDALPTPSPTPTPTPTPTPVPVPTPVLTPPPPAPVNAVVRGVVTGPDGAALNGATVKVEEVWGDFETTVSTLWDGTFVVVDVPKFGPLLVTAQKETFLTEAVRIEDPVTDTHVDVQLDALHLGAPTSGIWELSWEERPSLASPRNDAPFQVQERVALVFTPDGGVGVAGAAPNNNAFEFWWNGEVDFDYRPEDNPLSGLEEQDRFLFFDLMAISATEMSGEIDTYDDGFSSSYPTDQQVKARWIGPLPDEAASAEAAAGGA